MRGRRPLDPDAFAVLIVTAAFVCAALWLWAVMTFFEVATRAT